VRQAAAFMDVDLSTGARRLRALCAAGLIGQLEFNVSRSKVFAPTRAGCGLCGDGLMPIESLRLSTFDHDSKLVDCSMSLAKRFAGECEPERRLRHRGFSIQGHLPDLLLHRSGEPPVGVELELSIKARPRLEKILDAYESCSAVREVWYVTMGDDVHRLLKELARDRHYVRVLRWRKASAERNKNEGSTSHEP
jgi:hypothetical protein